MRKNLIYVGIILLSITNLFSFDATVYKESKAGNNYLIDFSFKDYNPQIFMNINKAKIRIIGNTTNTYRILIDGKENNNEFSDNFSSNQNSSLNKLLEKYGYNNNPIDLLKSATYKKQSQIDIEYNKVEKPLKIFSKNSGRELHLESIENSEINEIIIYIPTQTAISGKIRKGTLSLEYMDSELNLASSKIYGNIKNSKGVVILDSKSGNINIEKFDGVFKSKMTTGEITLKDIKGMIDLRSNILEVNMENIEANTNIKSNVIQIDVDNFTGNKLKIKSNAGEVNIDESNSNATIDVDITAGNIEIQDSKFKQFKCNTSGGELELKNVIGAIDIDSSAGDIIIKNFTPSNKITSLINLTFGDIYLSLKGNNYKFYKTGSNNEISNKTTSHDNFREITVKNFNDKKIIDVNVSTGNILLNWR